MWASQQRVLLIVTPRSFSTKLTCILLSHILISWSQCGIICCLCLDEIYIRLVLEPFNDMLFELHQDKTFCKSVVTVSTNVYIEWLGVPIMVSSARVRGVDHLHKSGRVLAQGQIIGARMISPPFYQKFRQHSWFVKKCQCNTVQGYGSKDCDRPDQTL